MGCKILKRSRDPDHILRLVAVTAWWPITQCARVNHLLVCNFCQIFADFNFFSHSPRLKYVATLPCNASLIACFLALAFYKVVCQHV